MNSYQLPLFFIAVSVFIVCCGFFAAGVKDANNDYSLCNNKPKSKLEFVFKKLTVSYNLGCYLNKYEE